MRARWFLLLALLALLARAPEAVAQTGTAGAISGHVFDAAGNPLGGATLVVESAALMGQRTAHSNEEGFFNIIGLPPGKYKVTASAPGLSPVVTENIDVGITSATEIDLLMQGATELETVTIVVKPTNLSTTRATVKETYDLEMVEAIPFNDPIDKFRAIIDMTPGTINRRVRGGGQRQTLFMQDGFEIKEQFPSLRSSAAFEIQTAAYGADAPTASGGVENLVTRSGSNNFQFEFTAVADTSQTLLFQDLGEPSTGQKRLVLNPTISGPFIKDKLWYHLNMETFILTEPQPRDPLLVLPETEPFFNLIQKWTFKTRWQMDSRNSLELLTNGDIPYQENNRRNPGISDDAQQDRLAQRYFLGLTYESLLTDSLLFRSQAGYIAFLQDIRPANCRSDRLPDNCFDIPNVRQRLPTALEYANGPVHQKPTLYSLQFVNTLEWSTPSSFGEHSVKVRDTVYLERDRQENLQTGDGFYEYNGTVATNFTTFYANDPRLEAPRYGWWKGDVESAKHVLTLSDTWSVTPRLTALPALSFVQAWANNSADTFPFDTHTFAPAASLVWDVSGDGATVLRTSASVYVDIDVTLVGRHALGTQVRERCGFNPVTQEFDRDCAYSGGVVGATVGLPCGPTGLDENGNSCKQELDIPRTYEYTAGVSQALGPGFAFGADAIYRKFANQFETIETNRIWDDSGTAVLGFRNGINQTVLDLQTPDGAYREYFGVTLSLQRNEGALRFNGSYTLGFLYGTVLDGITNLYGNIPPQDHFVEGYLADDHRHELKLTAQYQLAPWLHTGLRYVYTSGTPYNHLFYNRVTNDYDTLLSQVGTDPGADLNDPSDDRTLRQPDLQSINLQIRARLQPFIGSDLSVFAEVLNVFGLRTPLTLGTDDGTDFGLVLTRVDPFRIRFGVDYRWPSGG